MRPHHCSRRLRHALTVAFSFMVEEGSQHEIRLHISDTAAAGSYKGVLRISFPEASGLEPKEITLHARIRRTR